MKIGEYTTNLKDTEDVAMYQNLWYYTDLAPLYKRNKVGGQWMTYTYHVRLRDDNALEIRGMVIEKGKKVRFYDSIAKIVTTKSHRQACWDQMLSKWNKKVSKDGWVLDKEGPQPIKEPMLLHRWDKAKKKSGPWLVGTKLDGLCSFYLPKMHEFYSRKRSTFEVPELRRALCDISMIGVGAHGEIYKHGYTWEEISGAVSRGRDAERDSSGDPIRLQNSELEFHMFDRHDMPQEGYLQRLESLLDLTIKSPLLHVVPSVYCETEEEVEKCMEDFLKLDFEGAVARTLDGMYVWDSRSYEVLKLKPLFSKEFLLHSITSDNDAKFGRLISYILLMADGTMFKATPSKSKEERAKDYERLKMHPLPGPLWMTCEYRDVYANGKPKFAVAKGFRDDIDMGEA